MPISANAMQEDMISNPALWAEYADDVVILPYTENDGYSGSMRYYSDVKSNCFYFSISYTQDSLSRTENAVSIFIDITNESNEYHLEMNDEGLVGGKEKAPFDVAVNFGSASEQGQEIYAGIEFLNKVDKKEKKCGRHYDYCQWKNISAL